MRCEADQAEEGNPEDQKPAENERVVVVKQPDQRHDQPARGDQNIRLPAGAVKGREEHRQKQQ